MMLRLLVCVPALLLGCLPAFAFEATHGRFRKDVSGIGRTTSSPNRLLSNPPSRLSHPRSTAVTTSSTQLWDSSQWWDTSQRRIKRSSYSNNRRLEQQQAEANAPRPQYHNRPPVRSTNKDQPRGRRSAVQDVNYYIAGTNDHYDVRQPVVEEENNVIVPPPPIQSDQGRYAQEQENFNNNKKPSATSLADNNKRTPRQRSYSNQQQKTFAFQYKSEPYKIALDLDAALRHEYHASAQRQYLYDSTTEPPSNWQEEFYRMFLSHPDDGHVVEQLLQELIRITDTNDHDTLLEVVVAFVQEAISYNWNTFHRVEERTTLYPFETLHDQTGVCADKSILLARLLVELGYDCVFFAFEAANHIAVGVRVPRGMDDYNSGYAYIETTSCGPIGRIPTKLVGNVHLDEMPVIHRITTGGRVFERIGRNKQIEREEELKYGKEYFFLAPEQKQLKRDMVMLEQEIHHLDQNMDNCQSKTNLTEEQFHECQRLVDEHNRRVELYNAMVALFNTLNNNSDRSSPMQKP